MQTCGRPGQLGERVAMNVSLNCFGLVTICLYRKRVISSCNVLQVRQRLFCLRSRQSEVLSVQYSSFTPHLSLGNQLKHSATETCSPFSKTTSPVRQYSLACAAHLAADPSRWRSGIRNTLTMVIEIRVNSCWCELVIKQLPRSCLRSACVRDRWVRSAWYWLQD